MKINLEQQYSEKIDCTFHLKNFEELIILFEEAKSISVQSVFRFLEEVFLTSKRNFQLNKENYFLILNYVNSRFDHPIKWLVFYTGICKINGNKLPVKKVLIYMNELKKYYQFFAALNIVKGSVRYNSKINMVEDFYDEIIKYWIVSP